MKPLGIYERRLALQGSPMRTTDGGITGKKIPAPCVSHYLSQAPLSGGVGGGYLLLQLFPRTFAPTKTALPSQIEGPTSWKDTGAS